MYLVSLSSTRMDYDASVTFFFLLLLLCFERSKPVFLRNTKRLENLRQDWSNSRFYIQYASMVTFKLVSHLASPASEERADLVDTEPKKGLSFKCCLIFELKGHFENIAVCLFQDKINKDFQVNPKNTSVVNQVVSHFFLSRSLNDNECYFDGIYQWVNKRSIKLSRVWWRSVYLTATFQAQTCLTTSDH